MTRGTGRSLIAAASSAVLCSATAYPVELWALAPVCLLPLIVVATRESPLNAVGAGLLHGLLVSGIALYWVQPAMMVAGGLTLAPSVLLWVLLLLIQSLRTAAFAVLVHLGTRASLPVVATVPLAAVASDLLLPQVFPWYTGSYAGSAVPWLQLAEFGGPLALSFWVALTNGFASAAWMVRTRSKRQALHAIVAHAATLLLVTGIGELLLQRTEARMAGAPKGRIGVVQSNTRPADWTNRDPWGEQVAASRRALGQFASLDLVIWPETALPLPVRASALPGLGDAVSTALGVPLLTGLPVEDEQGRLSNSAVLFGGAGRVLGHYRKRALVPLGEASVFPALETVVPAVTAFSPGPEGSNSLPLGHHRLSVSICYEALLAPSFRESVRHDTDLLVNLTSDAWFAGSPGPHLHLALASLRAVEHRRYLLRATTTGVTAVVAPTGRIAWTLPEGRAVEGVAEIRFLATPTLYAKVGDLPWYVLSGCFLATLLARALLRPGTQSPA